MDETISIRKRLGFPTKAEFLKKHAIYTRKSLLIAGHEIMQRWETNYMKMLAAIACMNGGKILEVGFGMGISAHFIETHRPRVIIHEIIEAHPEVCECSLKMFENEFSSGDMKLLPGFWQDVIQNLEPSSYDGILFDTYPLTEKEIHKNHFPFFKEAFRLLNKNGILTYYSDEADKFSKEHLLKLHEAGFNNIEWKTCRVNPPKGSMYWRKNTLLAPIIRK